jgi:hypothetical protein
VDINLANDVGVTKSFFFDLVLAKKVKKNYRIYVMIKSPTRSNQTKKETLKNR